MVTNELSRSLRASCILLVAGALPANAGSPPATPAYQAGFPVMLDGTQVRASSVSLGDLTQDGVPEIVVGTVDGKVHAYEGDGTPLWDPPFDTGDLAVEAKPAIADVDADGFAEVVVGAGTSFTAGAGGNLYVLDHLGSEQCRFVTLDTGDPTDGFPDGVSAPTAVADLVPGDGGQLELAVGAKDRMVRVLEHDCTPVWEVDVFETVFGAPAIGDIDDDGQLDVVIGVQSDENNPDAAEDGGLLFAYDGATGDVLTGFPVQVDEVIWSSPALGDLTGDGRLEIVVGTGYCWADPACPTPTTNPGVGQYINAWDHQGNDVPGWPVNLPQPFEAGVHRYARASPALADLDGDGQLEVIINTIDPADLNDGQVYALNADGSNVAGWPKRPILPAGGGNTISFSTGASPVVADITGDGDPEVILPSNWDLVVWDNDGNQLSRDDFPTPAGDFELRTNRTISSSAAVGDIDGDGDLELVVGGFFETPAVDPGNTGAIYAWDFPGTSPGPRSWPMARNSADNRALSDSAIFIDGFESGDTSAW